MSTLEYPRADIARAANKALEIIRAKQLARPPVNPDAVAEDEQIRIVYARFVPPDNDRYSGFFRLDDNTIVVNEDIPDNRITFTIAHELGHYFLHQEYIKSNNYIPMPRRDRYEGPKPIEETEADTFAANLLVPFFMLKEYRDFATERELARLFFVSEDVIRNRLDTLKRYPGLAKAP